MKNMVDKDLLLINVLSVALILAIVFIPDSSLRIAMGLPFVLLFPGYTLICALFPGKRDLDGIERTSLSIGLSLAIVPLIGLMLNYTPFGIRLHTTVVSLFLFILLMSILSIYRRNKLPSESRFAPYLSVKIPKWRALRPDKIVSVWFIVCIVVVGGITAYVASMPRVGERFTEFYVLGSGGKIENYPTNLTLGESATVILGVVNHEHEEVTYRIVIKLDNETIGTIDDDITLNHEMKWEKKYTFTPDKNGEKMKLYFLLFREDIDEVYRSLHLWITVRPQK